MPYWIRTTTWSGNKLGTQDPNGRISAALKRVHWVGASRAQSYLIASVFPTLPDFLGSFNDKTPLS